MKKSDAELEEARMLVALLKTNSVMNREKKTILFKSVRDAWLQTHSVKFTSTADRDADYCNLHLSVLDDMYISQINQEDILNRRHSRQKLKDCENSQSLVLTGFEAIGVT